MLGLEKGLPDRSPKWGLKMVSHPEEEILDAAILVYVTNSEGPGSGAPLAMSAAVPVIASRIGRTAGSHPRRRERAARRER